MGDVGGVGNCCADAGGGGMLPVLAVALAEAAVRWWRSLSFFMAFDMVMRAS